MFSVLFLVLAAGSGLDEKTAEPSGAEAPADAARVAAAGLKIENPTPRRTGPTPVVQPSTVSVSPPSVLPAALCEELRNPAPFDRAALDAERKSLDKLAVEIARSRKALKVETARLEALAAKVASAHPRPPDPIVPDAPSDAQQLAVLAKTLKAMKAPEAAELIARMKPGLAVELLRRLSPKSAAALIARLKPELAASLVATLATKPVPEGRP